MPTSVGVVVLDELLSPQGMHHRGLQLGRQRNQLVVRSLAAGAPEDGDLLRPVQEISRQREFRRRGANHGCGMLNAEGAQGWVRTLPLQHISGDDDHGHAAARAMAVRKAMPNTRGICSAWEINSQ